MNKNYNLLNINKSKSKNAFTYLELIIIMGLVSIVVFLSSPFLATLSKKHTPYGEFICYAKYVEDFGWKLYQNQRINSPEYQGADEEADPDTGCVFSKPAGINSLYTIDLFGGGGSGSSPYYISKNSNGINIVEGNAGSTGIHKTIQDSLERVFKQDTITIKLCNDNYTNNDGTPVSICIGKGGDINNNKGSYETYYRVKNILFEMQLDSSYKLTNADISFLKSLDNESINTAIDTTNTSLDELKNCLARYLNLENYVPSSEKNTGKSGEHTIIKISDGTYIVALGGKYGISDPPIKKLLNTNNNTLKRNENDLYCYPNDFSNSKTDNNNPSDENIDQCNNEYNECIANIEEECSSTGNITNEFICGTTPYENYNNCIKNSNNDRSTCFNIFKNECFGSVNNNTHCQKSQEKINECINNKNNCMNNNMQCKNCNGANASSFDKNTAPHQDTGLSGGSTGGIFCKGLEDVSDYTKINISDGSLSNHQCYIGPGGRGAGGAIVISW